MFTICGDEALDPAGVAKICREHPQDEVYCIPWVRTEDELIKNLTVNKGRPNRVFPCVPNEEFIDDLPDESTMDIDPKLPGDVYGRMSYVLRSGRCLVNQVMKTPCHADFYGNIMERGPGAPRYIVAVEDMHKYFPQEPLSIKLYAATTVFVRMRGSEEFTKMVGNDVADVMFATPFVPGIQEFMGWLRMMTGDGLVGSFRPTEIFPRKNIPLFRYNKGYSVPFNDYVEMFESESHVI
jgi:hypothetical protein